MYNHAIDDFIAVLFLLLTFSLFVISVVVAIQYINRDPSEDWEQEWPDHS